MAGRTLRFDIVTSANTAAITQVQAQLKGLQSQARQSQAGFSKIDSAFGKFSQGAAAAAGLAAVGTAMMSVVNAASEFQQGAGAIDAIFKDQASKVIDGAASWAKYGLSQNEVLKNSALLGNQLKQIGVPMDQLVPKTNELLKLSADLAATFGGTAPQALEALQAGLRGQYARLDTFGINITETMVSATAAAEGLTKQQAFLKLAFEQSADAAGQSDRELNTFASKQARAVAEFENAKVAIGEGLLPVATQVASALGGIGGAFAAIPGPAVQVGFAIAGLIGVSKGTTAALTGLQARLLTTQAAMLKANKGAQAWTAGLGAMAVGSKAAGRAVNAFFAAFLVGSTANAFTEAADYTDRYKEALEGLSDASISPDALQLLDDAVVRLRILADPSLVDRADAVVGAIANFVGYEATTRNNVIEQLKQFDTALAGIAQTDPQAATAGLDAIRTKMEGLGITGEELKGLLPQTFAALDEAGTAASKVDQLTASFNELQETAELVSKALEEVFAPRDLAEANIALRESRRELRALLLQQGLSDDQRRQGVIDFAKTWDTVREKMITADKSQGQIFSRWRAERGYAREALEELTNWSPGRIKRELDLAFASKRELKVALKEAAVKDDLVAVAERKARAAARAAQRAIDGVKQGKKPQIDADERKAKAAARSAQRAVDGVKQRRRPVIDAAEAKARAAARAAQRAVDGVKQRRKATIEAAETNAKQAARAAQRAIDAVKQDRKPKIDVDDAPAQRTIQNTKTSLANIPDERVTVYVDVAGPGADELGGGGETRRAARDVQASAARSGRATIASFRKIGRRAGDAYGRAFVAAANKQTRRLRQAFLGGKFNFANNFELDAKLTDKNTQKVKDAYRKVIDAARAQYEKLYRRLEERERKLADLRRDIAEGVSAFSIGDQISGAKDVEAQIADLKKQLSEATRESFDGLDDVLVKLRAATDPATIAALTNEYSKIVAAGPRIVADTAKQKELREQIAKLQGSDPLSQQITKQAKATRQFAAQLGELKRKGVSADKLAEIAKAGPEAGLTLARQLNANRSLRDQWVAAFNDMQRFSTGIGQSIADLKFGKQVTAAKKALRKAWAGAADELTAALRKKLRDADLKVDVDVNLKTGKGKSSAAVASAGPVYNLTINGAIDPEGTARAVNKVLRQHAKRTGAAA